MEMRKMDDLCSIEDSLINCVKGSAGNFGQVENLEELKEVVDAIKDIAEAKKYCCEAKYYHSVADAMKKAEENPDMYHRDMYDRMGYPMEHEPMRGRMGYNRNRYSSSGRYAPSGHGERMGYENPEYTGAGDRKYGYHPSKYGMNYERYRDTRRHYTETNDQNDLEKMNQNAKDHLDSVTESLRDMWNDANQNTRDQIRETINRLAQELI